MVKAQSERRGAVVALLRLQDDTAAALIRAGTDPAPVLAFVRRADRDASRVGEAWEPAWLAVKTALLSLAQAVECKPDASNPLLAEQAIHADLKPLLDALALACSLSGLIVQYHNEMTVRKESHWPLNAEDWPGSEAHMQWKEWAASTERKIQAEEEGNGEECVYVTVCDSGWPDLIQRWSKGYENWCSAISSAIEAAKSPLVAAIMDAGEPRPMHRWTTQVISELNNLAGALHPIRLGEDGLGVIRSGLPPLPDAFMSCIGAVRSRINELRSISVSATHTSPAFLKASDSNAKAEHAAHGSSVEVESNGPTMRDLADEAGVSDDTFRRVRKAAGIIVRLRGAKARNRRYSRQEVDRLRGAARAGAFIERISMYEKWAKWGSK